MDSTINISYIPYYITILPLLSTTILVACLYIASINSNSWSQHSGINLVSPFFYCEGTDSVRNCYSVDSTFQNNYCSYYDTGSDLTENPIGSSAYQDCQSKYEASRPLPIIACVFSGCSIICIINIIYQYRYTFNSLYELSQAQGGGGGRGSSDNPEARFAGISKSNNLLIFLFLILSSIFGLVSWIIGKQLFATVNATKPYRLSIGWGLCVAANAASLISLPIHYCTLKRREKLHRERWDRLQRINPNHANNNVNNNEDTKNKNNTDHLKSTQIMITESRNKASITPVAMAANYACPSCSCPLVVPPGVLQIRCGRCDNILYIPVEQAQPILFATPLNNNTNINSNSNALRGLMQIAASDPEVENIAPPPSYTQITGTVGNINNFAYSYSNTIDNSNNPNSFDTIKTTNVEK